MASYWAHDVVQNNQRGWCTVLHRETQRRERRTCTFALLLGMSIGLLGAGKLTAASTLLGRSGKKKDKRSKCEQLVL
jgi:hypothetical protein